MGNKTMFVDAEIKSANIKTKSVKLLYIVPCGCGVTDVEIERVVDENSPLQDGDLIHDLLPTDKRL